MTVDKFTLTNEEKLHRAIYGSLDREGRETGGLLSKLGLESVDEIPEDQLLAEYDRLGGHILQGKYKIKTGSFWDFKNKCPKKKPDPTITIRVEGEEVEFPADKPVPLEVQASEIVRERKTKKKLGQVVEKTKKVKKTKRETLEDEE